MDLFSDSKADLFMSPVRKESSTTKPSAATLAATMANQNAMTLNEDGELQPTPIECDEDDDDDEVLLSLDDTKSEPVEKRRSPRESYRKSRSTSSSKSPTPSSSRSSSRNRQRRGASQRHSRSPTGLPEKSKEDEDEIVNKDDASAGIKSGRSGRRQSRDSKSPVPPTSRRSVSRSRRARGLRKSTSGDSLEKGNAKGRMRRSASGDDIGYHVDMNFVDDGMHLSRVQFPQKMETRVFSQELV